MILLLVISRRTVKSLAYPMKLSDLVLVEGQKNLCYHNSLVEGILLNRIDSPMGVSSIV
jgi:hypothetical protein